MSKSLGNYIGVAEPPAEIFGKVMSISDAAHAALLRAAHAIVDLRRSVERCRAAADPMGAKKQLAALLVERFHGAAAAAAARRGFEERFQQRHLDAAALDEITVRPKDGRIWLPGLLHDGQPGEVELRGAPPAQAACGAHRRRDGRERRVSLRGAAELVLEVGKRRAIRVRVAV